MHDIFYFTDVHGCYNLYKAAIDYCMEQDPECTIIFGGDACDRGKDGYKIMKELLDNPQVLYLKGNHEDIFVHAAISIQLHFKKELNHENVFGYLYHEKIADYGDPAIQLCLYNGGFQTLYDWMMDGMPEEFVKQIVNLPVTFSYENLDFCHAGGNYNTFERGYAAEYNDDWIDKDDLMILIWDRNYLGQGWKEGRTCIFGHTPTPYLAAKYYGKDKSLANAHPCAYVATLDDKWTGRKIDMDTGAIASGKLYVLNCLTMKAQGFRDSSILGDNFSSTKIEKIECIQF